MQRKYYHCSCGSAQHYLSLWINSDDVYDDDTIDIDIGWHYIPLKNRLRVAWNILRGNPDGYETVMLDLSQSESFAQEILEAVEIRRENT